MKSKTRYVTSHHFHGSRQWESLYQAQCYVREMKVCDRLYASKPFAGTYTVDGESLDVRRAWCVYATPSARDADDTGAWAWHIADVRDAREVQS